MSDGLFSELARQRRQRVRGWTEIGIGIALIAVGIVVTYLSLKSATKAGGGLYLVVYGPVVSGFAALGRGVVRVIASPERVSSFSAPEKRSTTTIAVGFKSFIAYRYLMARSHRVSKLVALSVIFSLFFAVAALVVAHSLLTRANPLGLDLETLELMRHVLAGIEVFGLVFLILAAIVGVLRYTFTFFTTVPLVGVWIGTGALVIVLSVMSGFESDLREKFVGANAHIQVSKVEGDFTDWRAVKKKIDAVPGVVASTPFATSEVVIAANGNGMNVIIKGIDPDSVGKVTELVKDLDDKDALKRLQPEIADEHDLRVPQVPRTGSAGLDPAPADMPSSADPIDFSQPAPEGSADEGSAAANTMPPAPPHDLDVGSGSARAEHLVGSDPPDVITSAAPRIDHSGSKPVDPKQVVHAVPEGDLSDSPSMSQRTLALPGILVGKELVKQTHLYTGEEVRVVSPLSDPSNPDATGTPIPFNRDYRVAGVFFTGMYEYDLKYVYVTLDSLQEFLDRGDTLDGIEVRTKSADDTDIYVERISAALGKDYRVQDWKELNHSLFSALKLEKVVMFLVLGIVILVASFSIVGNLIMVVVEKAREIALIKTLGASDRTIMKIFAIQGLLIGLIGTALGISTGLIACYIGKAVGIPLNPDVYYIDRMPVNVEPTSVILTAAAGVLISMAATFYPALLAARVRPAAGMRH
jgi:lipoprotein-releasing system permease protein